MNGVKNGDSFGVGLFDDTGSRFAERSGLSGFSMVFDKGSLFNVTGNEKSVLGGGRIREVEKMETAIDERKVMIGRESGVRRI